MARSDVNETQAGAGSAPAVTPEGGDVKIDIEVEGDEPKKDAAAAAPEASSAEAKDSAPAGEGAGANAAAESEEAEYVDPDEDRARVEAAIKAGEAAADADFKSEADKLRAERDELAKKLDGVADEIKAAKAEAASSADRLARLQADWDNYRRRTERDRAAERERACEGLVKDLLPVIDDLERAVAHASGASEGNEVAKQLVDGVSAVHAKVISVLEKQGVEVIDPAGKAFDPNEHQAVGRVENAGVYDETVADVYQKGYRLGGKIVRPAMVTVSYGGAKRPAETEPDAGDGSETK